MVGQRLQISRDFLGEDIRTGASTLKVGNSQKALKFCHKQRFGKSLMFGERNRESEKHTQPLYHGITVEGGAEINSITQEKFFLEHSPQGPQHRADLQPQQTCHLQSAGTPLLCIPLSFQRHQSQGSVSNPCEEKVKTEILGTFCKGHDPIEHSLQNQPGQGDKTGPKALRAPPRGSQPESQLGNIS